LSWSCAVVIEALTGTTNSADKIMDTNQRWHNTMTRF
jgi:hypothetical protein